MSSFEVTRSATIQAEAATIHALINDFHEWTKWSPWEDVDPDLQRTYTGPDAGVGASYAWSGNRKAGQGSMTITESIPEQIAVKLSFLKPWKATNDVFFSFGASGDGTEVTWRMTGENTGVAGLFTKVFNMEKFVGKDMEKGLARLKANAEQSA
jgi:hypothetical protein